MSEKIFKNSKEKNPSEWFTEIIAKADETGGANLAKAIDVNTNGIAVKVDDVTIEGDSTSGRLKVKQDGTIQSYFYFFRYTQTKEGGFSESGI